jgi:hypothetical protein
MTYTIVKKTVPIWPELKPCKVRKTLLIDLQGNQRGRCWQKMYEGSYSTKQYKSPQAKATQSYQDIELSKKKLWHTKTDAKTNDYQLC